ncbi:zinc ribbon domain-containing protein [Arthrobacter deserti]|uniref:Zinc ribbon domain-containing protein n=1 Tax=Arthrobacter deserti TaxID=1742687 RepID=A0ABX1JNM1_9MICC|nr:zinc ribbon domain-containing protein [Arthrobacter deserti]
MPIYEFRCPQCSVFEETHAMASVPDTVSCPNCNSPSRRRISAPRLSIAGSAAFKLVDSPKRSAHAPEVVSSLPAPGRRKVQAYTANPLHKKLPRP